MITSWDQLQPEYSRLQSMLLGARAAAATTILPEGARNGILTQLTIIARYVARLGSDGDLGRGVQSGSVSLRTWANVANEQGRALNDVNKQLGDEGLVGRFWTEVIVQSVADGREVVTTVADAAPYAWGGIVTILVLLIVLKVVR